MAERLQKILARWGIASRRQAEQLIQSGRVRLNGEVITTLGHKADPTVDQIEVDGRPLESENQPAHLYLLLNKPAGVLSTCDDPQARRTVLDLLPAQWRSGQGLHPVGRLDADSTGALLLTNDGELTYGLTHPHYPGSASQKQVAKTYQVQVQGHPALELLAQWRSGIELDGRLTLPAKVRVLHRGERTTTLEIVLQEGRNRQIRRVAEQLGHPVLKLHRLAIGPLNLGKLAVGAYRVLSPAEVQQLKAAYSSASDFDHSDIRGIQGARSA
ncbi:pseudouridine synthase [Leptolyngbya sp. FACHB-261]|uniref:pseudouridine synthase n=1 Tax=Leptolyngbya sp. FACHB-261 TaxID=2692806 RepID=UPI001685C239|nr:pseudouridine synthase [Leptolyngbya sp. FACHB-261]MBD2104929.1 rRNA pseudouridine synthase [Leptolyngbya sp. FACHB-261]